MSHTKMSQEEEEEREEALAEVVDPLFLMRGEAEADMDAEGEIEIDGAPADEFTMSVDAPMDTAVES